MTEEEPRLAPRVPLPDGGQVAGEGSPAGGWAGGRVQAGGAALSEAAAELDAVQAALGRLDDGTFDRCEVCGAPIGVERLQEEPLLTRCVLHTSA